MSSCRARSRAPGRYRSRARTSTNSSGTTLTTLATFSNLNKTAYAYWTLVTLTIAATFAVSGNNLSFSASEDVSLQTSFFIDTVAIQ